MSQLLNRINELTGVEMLTDFNQALGSLYLTDEMIINLMEYQIELFEHKNYIWEKSLDYFNPKNISKRRYADKRFITFDEYKKYVELPIDKDDLIVHNNISHALRQKSKENPDNILQDYYSLMKEKAPLMANFFFWW